MSGPVRSSMTVYMHRRRQKDGQMRTHIECSHLANLGEVMTVSEGEDLARDLNSFRVLRLLAEVARAS